MIKAMFTSTAVKSEEAILKKVGNRIPSLKSGKLAVDTYVHNRNATGVDM